MSETRKEPGLSPKWTRLWIAMQEVGAELNAIIESDEPPPDWVVDLRSVLDYAEDKIEDEIGEVAP